MQRRKFLSAAIDWVCRGISGGWFFLAVISRAHGQRPERTPDLRQQLEYGLRARRPSEFAFIARVVQLVYDGVLPQKVVLAAFNWARDKRPYPFPYFVRAIQILAARYGVDISYESGL